MRAIDVASFTLPPPAPCVAPRGCRLGLALAAGAEATGAAAGVTDAASGEAEAAGTAAWTPSRRGLCGRLLANSAVVRARWRHSWHWQARVPWWCSSDGSTGRSAQSCTNPWAVRRCRPMSMQSLAHSQGGASLAVTGLSPCTRAAALCNVNPVATALAPSRQSTPCARRDFPLERQRVCDGGRGY